MTGYSRTAIFAKGLWLGIWLTVGLAVAPGWGAMAAEPVTLRLWEGDAPGALGQERKDVPSLAVYLAQGKEASASSTAAVLVCPGGGYGGLAMDHEGRQIAEWYNGLGVSAMILDYRHRGKGYEHPAPLLDAQRALRQIRHRADGWHVDPQRIGVMGFSAGGHLASTLGTHFDRGRADDTDPIERVSCRPDFMILCYPVIALGEPFTHRGSQQNLLGPNPDERRVRQLSNEKQVTGDCPPTFLFHTDADQVVPAENSLVFYGALRSAKVPAELHVYQQGQHGVGLARDLPGTNSWPDRCVDWLRGLGVLTHRGTQPEGGQ
jgi:acetyl esterase/lipase